MSAGRGDSVRGEPSYAEVAKTEALARNAGWKTPEGAAEVAKNWACPVSLNKGAPGPPSPPGALLSNHQAVAPAPSSPSPRTIAVLRSAILSPQARQRRAGVVTRCTDRRAAGGAANS